MEPFQVAGTPATCPLTHTSSTVSASCPPATGKRGLAYRSSGSLELTWPIRLEKECFEEDPPFLSLDFLVPCFFTKQVPTNQHSNSQHNAESMRSQLGKKGPKETIYIHSPGRCGKCGCPMIFLRCPSLYIIMRLH